jgi:hypothetical protein
MTPDLEGRIARVERALYDEGGLLEQMAEIRTVGKIVRWGVPTAIALLGLILTLRVL